jgi:hypothetical protein
MLVRFILLSLFLSKFVIPRRSYSIMKFSLISCIFTVTQSFILWMLQRNLAPQIFFLPKTIVPYGIPFLLDGQRSTLDFWNVSLLTKALYLWPLIGRPHASSQRFIFATLVPKFTIALDLESVFTHLFDGYTKRFAGVSDDTRTRATCIERQGNE